MDKVVIDGEAYAVEEQTAAYEPCYCSDGQHHMPYGTGVGHITQRIHIITRPVSVP